MCVVALAINAHPNWSLLLIANRDEFHVRPAAALSRWDDDGAGASDVIAGRDLESGGSWLGVSASGRMAAVTNIRTDLPPASDKASRGDLVADFLKGEGDYADISASDGGDFNPFHLITLQHGGAVRHISNSPRPEERGLDDGIYALANEATGTPCERRGRLQGQLTNWLAGEAGDPSDMFDILGDHSGHRMEWDDSGRPAPGHRPNFLLGDIYGTRCSSIIAVDRQARGQIIERRFAADGIYTGQNRIEFEWS